LFPLNPWPAVLLRGLNDIFCMVGGNRSRTPSLHTILFFMDSDNPEKFQRACFSRESFPMGSPRIVVAVLSKASGVFSSPSIPGFKFGLALFLSPAALIMLPFVAEAQFS